MAKKENNMTQRIIKFRAWNTNLGLMQYGLGAEGHFFDKALELNYPVMQFTGLLDRNGKEIWEGDIMKYIGNPKRKNTRRFTQTVFENLAWYQAFKDGALIHRLTNIVKNRVDHEVVGNIYENPELLKD